jgi:hypothetical protein
VGRDCPEWLKSVGAPQYLDSAAQGLRFFFMWRWLRTRIEWIPQVPGQLCYIDCDEGMIDDCDIVENWQRIFDQKWHWQLKDSEDFKYLVRSPPPPTHTSWSQQLSSQILLISR